MGGRRCLEWWGTLGRDSRWLLLVSSQPSLSQTRVTMATCASSRPVPGGDGGRYLLQAALEHGPLHVPGRLVAGVLLLQPQPGALVLPQLGAQVLQQGLQRAEQLLVLHRLRGHGRGLSPHGRVFFRSGEERSLAIRVVLGCFQGATGNGRRARASPCWPLGPWG